MYEVLDSPDGGAVQATYLSAKSLIAALTKNPHHGLTFDRYFGLDREFALPPVGGSVLDLFRPVAVPEHAKAITISQPIVVPTSVPITVLAETTKKLKRLPPVQVEGGPVLGIDLAKRGKEVRKLFYAGFGARVARHGYDPEEVLQEVYRGLLARNNGICPFDVRKSSFGHYCHLVISCILNNYHRKEARHRQVEQVGMTAPISMREGAEGDGGMVDAASVAETSMVSDYASFTDGGMTDAVRRLNEHLAKKGAGGAAIDPLAPKVAALLAEGMNRQEIARAVGVGQNRVSQALVSLREHAGDWL